MLSVRWGRRRHIIKLFLQRFQPRRNNTVDTHKIQESNQLLNLSRIQLKNQAGVRPSDDHIKDAVFFVVLTSRADATCLIQVVMRLELILESMRVWFGPCGGGARSL